MSFSTIPIRGTHLLLLLLLILSSSLHFCSASNSSSKGKLFSLVKETPLTLQYHNGPLLTGNLSLSILWYGRFSLAQKSILLDFLQSLNAKTLPKPSVSSWWKTLETYHSIIHPPKPRNYNSALRVHVINQTLDDSYSHGKSLTHSQLVRIVSGPETGSVAVLLTSDDVAIEGFCIGGCSTHGTVGPRGRVYVWVGNSASQCPGECAWPFHQPIYGPQGPPLVAPNGDMGADGMVISLASGLAGAVTNPFRTGFFQGPASAPLEAASACTGAFGSGAYPGFPGDLLVDPTTGGSFNAHGVNGRKYLLPAVWDPITSKCSTLV